jgi:hypothetical protein
MKGSALLLAMVVVFAPVALAEATRAEYDFVDTNDDGYVSSSEHEVYARKLFDQMDADGDYKLSVAEIMADPPKFFRHVFSTGNMLGPAEIPEAEKIQRMDMNKDGVISRDEHANAATAKFQHLDINNDGVLTWTEFSAGG